MGGEDDDDNDGGETEEKKKEDADLSKKEDSGQSKITEADVSKKASAFLPKFIFEAGLQLDATLIDTRMIKMEFTRFAMALTVEELPPEPSASVSADLEVTLDGSTLNFVGGIEVESESIKRRQHTRWAGGSLKWHAGQEAPCSAKRQVSEVRLGETR